MAQPREADPASQRAPAAGASASAAAHRAAPRAADARRQRAIEAEQRELRVRLEQARQRIARAEATRTETADMLRASERAISDTNRRLRELRAERQGIERRLVELRQLAHEAAMRESDQALRAGVLLRMQIAAAREQPWQRLVDGEPPGRRERDLAVLGHVTRGEIESLRTTAAERAQLALLRAEAHAQQEELAANARAEQSARNDLMRQQAARRAALDRVARRIDAQRASLATLERDERRLSGLLAEIEGALAEQARRAAARQAAADRHAAARRESERSAADGRPAPRRADEPPAQSRNASADEPARAAPAAASLPVRGTVVARFGTPRRTEAGIDASTWKGVFIRAANGTEVTAPASGRVVFADWLRGFGNLLVIDHGNGTLTVYGNNESLLASVGDRVAAGAVIASVGSSGGNSEPGLYFEVRVQGRPIDPLRWAAAR